jgi:hypothetical protein
MSLINTFETKLLDLIFANVPCTFVGDDAGLLASAAPGNIYVSLHSSDPGEAAAGQDDNELTYTGYARRTAVRSASGWTVSGDTAVNAAVIAMGEMSAGGPQTSTHFGLGYAVSGTTVLYMTGTASLVINNGVDPEFAIGALSVQLN